MLRVCELIKREVGQVITRDYVFDALVTVNAVDVTPDLRSGHVFVGVLGTDTQKRKVIERLNREHGKIQQRINKRVVLKYSPKLYFELDDSVERGVRTLTLIQDIEAAGPTADELAAAAAAEAAADPDETGDG